MENRTQSLVFEGRSAKVIALRATSDNREYALPTNMKRWVIGAGPSCDIVIDDPFVSQLHCILERRDGGALVVRDRGSRNGTRVNNNPVEGAELHVGARLMIGRTTLIAVAATASGPTRAIEALRGHDPVFRTTIDHALRVAPTECNILIVGETGTGKDLLARAIHEASPRMRDPFVAVNCGAIPRELVASELFGHDKGAFTGAHAERDGYFVQADRGSLFLDEIGELPIELQPHLLRALETRRVRRVGGNSERHVDVRIIAATNRIEGLGTESSRLRLDLYHRLATVVLSLPPLRERMTDLAELVESMLAELAADHGRKQLTDDAWQALAGYAWPGNIRELRHAVARAVALGEATLTARDFFPDSSSRHTMGMPAIASMTGSMTSVASIASDRAGAADDDSLAPYEAMLRGAMEQALRSRGSIRAAAEQLGMPKSTFADKARAWGLAPRRKPKFPTRK